MKARKLMIHIGAASFLIGLLSTQSIAASDARPSARAACAAFDLHAFWQLDDAAMSPAIAPELIADNVERLLLARRLCAEGSTSRALEVYEALNVGLSLVRWLR